jgi:DNA-binding beta-propeller fold protein YncE
VTPGSFPVAVDSTGPPGLALNHTTHTLYVTNLGGHTVSVINQATCNAPSTSGCGSQAVPGYR